MFQKTFSFWRRLVQPSAEVPAAPKEASNEDRRLWVRYTANLDAHIDLPAVQGSKRVNVRVRDISLGGANLQCQQRFHSGQMITLELPTRSESPRAVLACVVRCQPEGDGYNVGCVFSRELADEDLEHFGAQRVVPDGADQRRWQRFDCKLKARYQLVGADKPPVPAQVLNISASGIGLQVNEPLETGSLLNLDLHDSEGEPVRSILACIVHTTMRAQGERAIGCNFIRQLSEEDLQLLL